MRVSTRKQPYKNREMPPVPIASVIVPTRNRCDTLRACITAALSQSVPVEVIVVDDGSTDGTKAMIELEFPQVRYRHFEGPNGPAFIRNKGSEMARGAILFPIDDDAIMVAPDTVERTLRDFDDPRVGAVAIPHINVRVSDKVYQQAPPAADTAYVTETYVGASHALRRELFLNLGGYREHLFYMGEEGDYCIRMLAAGYYVRLGTASPIHHLESPHRASWRMDYYGRRNDVLFAWHNVPTPYLPLHLAGTVYNGLRAAFRDAKHPFQMIRGTLAGFLGLGRYWNARKAVPPAVYKLSRRLKKRGPMPMPS